MLENYKVLSSYAERALAPGSPSSFGICSIVSSLGYSREAQGCAVYGPEDGLNRKSTSERRARRDDRILG